MGEKKKKEAKTLRLIKSLKLLLIFLSKDFQSLGLIRECREMVGASLTRPELSWRAKSCMGGRTCHRKHVEDG